MSTKTTENPNPNKERVVDGEIGTEAVQDLAGVQTLDAVKNTLKPTPKSNNRTILEELDDLANWTVTFNSSRYKQIRRIMEKIENEIK